MKINTDRRNFMKTGAGLGAGLLMGGVGCTQEKSSIQIKDFWAVIEKRRSVRAYQSTPVPDEHIKKIIDAARMAPTAGNQQPWKFLVIRDQQKLELLKEACIAANIERAKKSNPTGDKLTETKKRAEDYYSRVFSASVYIVVLTDKQSRYPTYNHHDGPLAAGYLALAARALGYGTVYYTDSIPEGITKDVLKIPERYTRVCITPVGVPSEWPDTPSKKDLDEMIIYETIG